MTDTVGRDRNVSRADIEGKLREIRGEVESTGEKVKTPVLTIAAVAVVVIVGVAYVLGRRRGRRTTTLVEVRRV